MKKQLLLGLATLSASAVVFSPKAANAFDLSPCPSTSPISSATACTYVDPLSAQRNDFADDPSVLSGNRVNVNNVNESPEAALPAEGFFGITDWEEAFKIDSDTGNGLIPVDHFSANFAALSRSHLGSAEYHSHCEKE